MYAYIYIYTYKTTLRVIRRLGGGGGEETHARIRANYLTA